MTIEKLRTIPCLANLTASELEEISDKLSPVIIKKGAYICKEGDKGEELYFVMSGSVKVLKECAPGHMEHILTVEAPSLLGEMAFLNKTPRSASLLTLKETSLLKLERKDFEIMIKEHKTFIPKLLLYFAEVLCKRLYALDTRVCEIISKAEKGKKTKAVAELEAFRKKLYSQWTF